MSRALQGLGLSTVLCAGLACGERFEAAPGDSAGGGGSGSQPSGGAAGSAAATGSGGVAGTGGVLGIGGVLGLGGTIGGQFPATAVLDDFERDDGDPGPSWTGSVSDFELEAGWLVDRAGTGRALFWTQRFGAAQEVFATLSRFDPAASEINLILKAQDNTDCEFVEVMYHPNSEEVAIAYCAEGTWTELGGTPIVLAPGDTLGARIAAGGRVEVFQNGTRFMIADTAGYPYQDGGRIGVNSLDPGAAWDDFGGGAVTP